MNETTLIAHLSKAVMDELSASIAYKVLAEKVIDAPELSDELKAHATDEMEHFNKIIELAAARGLCEQIPMVLDPEVFADMPSEKFAVIYKVQQLEKTAINDYAGIVVEARAVSDLEVERLFMELLREEQEHFDDLAQYTGQVRKS